MFKACHNHYYYNKVLYYYYIGIFSPRNYVKYTPTIMLYTVCTIPQRIKVSSKAEKKELKKDDKNTDMERFVVKPVIKSNLTHSYSCVESFKSLF